MAGISTTSQSKVRKLKKERMINIPTISTLPKRYSQKQSFSKKDYKKGATARISLLGGEGYRAKKSNRCNCYANFGSFILTSCCFFKKVD